MITSRLTTKAQTTVPQAVRNALGLKPGDQMAYQIESGRVMLVKVSPRDLEDPFATFSEWCSDEDTKAYEGF